MFKLISNGTFFDAEILKGKGKEGVMNINQKAKYIWANSTTRHNT